MAQWGRNDVSVNATSSSTVEKSNGAPIGTYALVKAGGQTSVRVNAANAHFGNTSAGSRANVDVSMFGNTTIGAFIPGKAVGVFGLDVNEMNASGGSITEKFVTTGGSGYASAPTVTMKFSNGTTNTAGVTSSLGSGATTGRVASLTIADAGSNIQGANPVVTIAAPAAVNIIANTTGFSNTAETLKFATANSKFLVGDRLYYSVPTGNTAIAGLTGNAYYYVVFANTSSIKVSSTSGGSPINITDARVATSPETHTVRGDTATGYVVLSGGKSRGAAHAGWVVRTEGSGGRAGRVQYETLVAMGSLGNTAAEYGTAADVTDASDDNQLPDS